MSRRKKSYRAIEGFQLWENASFLTKRALASDPRTSQELLLQLSKDQDATIRTIVADNKSTPVDVLINLSQDYILAVRRSIAGNPNTPIDVLDQLSKDHEPGVRSMVASNSNTSPETLIRLSMDGWHATRQNVCGNRNTPPGILNNLSRDPDHHVRKIIAANEHPNLSPDILDRLAEDPSHLVRKSVLLNSNIKPETLIKLAVKPGEYGKDISETAYYKLDRYMSRVDPEERRRIEELIEMAKLGLISYSNDLNLDDLNLDESLIYEGFKMWDYNSDEDPYYKDIPVKQLESLMLNGDFRIRQMVAEHPNTTSEILSKLTRDPESLVRFEVAQNEITDPKDLILLSKDESPDVREGVAANEMTPIEALIELSKDPIGVVRMRVSRNNKVTDDILSSMMEREESDTYVKREIAGRSKSFNVLNKLVKDPEPLIRIKVSKNMWLARYPDIIDQLIKDPDSMVRERLVANPVLPIEAIIKLTKDKDTIVNNHAKRKLEEYLGSVNPEEIKRVEDLISMQDLGISPSLGLDDIDLSSLDLGESNRAYNNFQLWESEERRWLDSKEDEQEWLKSGYNNISSELLAKGSRSSDEEIRQIVAEHPNTPIEILSKLSEDQDELVRSYVGSNKNTDPNTLFLLSIDESDMVRMNVAGNPNVPIKALEELSKDDDEEIRIEVANNPSVTEDILLLMLNKGKYSRYVTMAIAGRVESYDALKKFVKYNDSDIRIKAALNPHLSKYPDLVDELIKDDPLVTESLLDNPNLPIEYVIILTKATSYYTPRKAKAKLSEYLKNVDPAEQKRVEDLINIQDLGIRPEYSDLDLDSLDLGESYQAHSSFQLWEARKREEKRLTTTLGKFLDWYLGEEWEDDWRTVKDFIWVNGKEMEGNDAMAYHIKFVRNRDLKINLLAIKQGFETHTYFDFEGEKFMTFDYPEDEAPKQNLSDEEVKKKIDELDKRVFALDFLISWLEEDPIMKMTSKKEIVEYFWESIENGVSLDDINPDGFKKWLLYRGMNLN